MSAVIAANLLSSLIFYYFWLATKREQKGLDGYDTGIGPAFGALVGFAVMIGGLLLLGNSL